MPRLEAEGHQHSTLMSYCDVALCVDAWPSRIVRDDETMVYEFFELLTGDVCLAHQLLARQRCADRPPGAPPIH